MTAQRAAMTQLTSKLVMLAICALLVVAAVVMHRWWALCAIPFLLFASTEWYLRWSVKLHCSEQHGTEISLYASIIPFLPAFFFVRLDPDGPLKAFGWVALLVLALPCTTWIVNRLTDYYKRNP